MKEISIGRGYSAQVDDEDFEHLVTRYKWHALVATSGCVYARAHIRGQSGHGNKKILMHSVILKCPEGFQIDHWDGNGLNNQKYNLRILTNAQNKQAKIRKCKGTSSKFRGVFRHSGGWQVKVGGRYIGLFQSEHEAALARDAAARSRYGDIAGTNF